MFQDYSNTELALFLGLPISNIRGICYELGLKRMELEYFTHVQVSFLKRNYKMKGDSELAETFQVKWPKKKGWLRSM